MVYKSNLFKKEPHQSYRESPSNLRRLFTMCLFLAFLTIAVHMLLQIMYDSVMTELFPELMMPSYFTMAYTYNLIAYIFFAVYFITKYNSMTLAEIRENKWYMLSKMGFKSTNIIISKMLSSTFIGIFLYGTGFLLTMIVTALLKYPFVPEYILPAIVAGALNVLLIVQATLVISLFSKTRIHAKNSLLAAVIVNEILKYALGFYDLLTDRVLMTDVFNLFDTSHSAYGVIVLLTFLLLFVLAYIGAKKKSRFYSLKNELGGIAIIRYNNNKVITAPKPRNRLVYSLPGVLGRIALAAVLLASIVFNTLILIASLGSSTREFSMFGYIPYIFQSETMENEIYKNDLALFKQIDKQYPLNVGDIVLFPSSTSSSEASVMKITQIDGDEVVTDILNYPVLIEEGELQELVNRNDIYAIFYDNYRVLGAVILFINTFAGRVITMFIPILLLFFYRQIFDFIKRIKHAL